jgi:hypothetical protein
MDKAAQTMIENLHINTGKSLEEWIFIVQKQKIEKHGQIIKYLKENHGFTHGYANMVALKARGADAGSVDDKDSLIENQYKGKEHFLPLYESIIEEVKKFGNDVEIAVKNTSVSLRRKKQFALLQPATRTRFEIGINLKGQAPEGKLEENNASNAMCSHKINLAGNDELDREIFDWIRKAYDQSG